MADVQFSRADIEGLAQKLGTLQPDLSDQERALLLAIFAAAADRAEPIGPGPVARIRAAEINQTQATLTDLNNQLLNAYTPSQDFDSITQIPHPKVAGTPPPVTGESAPPGADE